MLEEQSADWLTAIKVKTTLDQLWQQLRERDMSSPAERGCG